MPAEAPYAGENRRRPGDPSQHRERTCPGASTLKKPPSAANANPLLHRLEERSVECFLLYWGLNKLLDGL